MVEKMEADGVSTLSLEERDEFRPFAGILRLLQLEMGGWSSKGSHLKKKGLSMVNESDSNGEGWRKRVSKSEKSFK